MTKISLGLLLLLGLVCLSQESDDNTMIVDGDELVMTSEVQGQSTSRDRVKRKIARFEMFPPGTKWNVTHIKYRIQTGFDPDEVVNIRKAAAYVASQTCFTFEEVENDALLDALLEFKKDKSCLTFLGRQESIPHTIFLNAGCTQEMGDIVHQILHALGMWHEHQRADRDDYVTINKDNMKEDEHDSFLVIPILVDDLGFRYDYTSIMHFSSKQFAKQGIDGHTLVPKGGFPEWTRRTMGQRVEMSFYDTEQLNLVYCSDLCNVDLPCRNLGYPDPTAISCDKCRCPHGFSGDLCQIVAAEQGEGANRCGGQQVDLEDTIIVSPGYFGTERYEPLTDCTWLLQSPQGTTMHFKFKGPFGVYSRGSAEVCYHWVEIRTQGQLTRPGIRFCGDQTPDVELISDTNLAMVLFKSLWEDTEPDQTRGFQLSVWIDLCENVVCENGGTCADGECNCEPGYYGDTCSLVDHCFENPCVNGQCINTASGFNCVCPPEFTGTYCQDELSNDPCVEHKCKNEATCVEDVDADDGYTCDCLPGSHGDYCQNGCGGCGTSLDHLWKEVNPCSETRMETRTKCVSSRESYTSSSRRRRRRRRRTSFRTVYRMVTYEDEVPLCGCGAKLMYPGKTTCALTGIGAWGTCFCLCGGCRRMSYRFDVVDVVDARGKTTSWHNIVETFVEDCDSSSCRSCPWYGDYGERSCMAWMTYVL